MVWVYLHVHSNTYPMYACLYVFVCLSVCKCVCLWSILALLEEKYVSNECMSICMKIQKPSIQKMKVSVCACVFMKYPRHCLWAGGNVCIKINEQYVWLHPCMMEVSPAARYSCIWVYVHFKAFYVCLGNILHPVDCGVCAYLKTLMYAYVSKYADMR